MQKKNSTCSLRAQDKYTRNEKYKLLNQEGKITESKNLLKYIDINN